MAKTTINKTRKPVAVTVVLFLGVLFMGVYVLSFACFACLCASVNTALHGNWLWDKQRINLQNLLPSLSLPISLSPTSPMMSTGGGERGVCSQEPVLSALQRDVSIHSAATGGADQRQEHQGQPPHWLFHSPEQEGQRGGYGFHRANHKGLSCYPDKPKGESHYNRATLKPQADNGKWRDDSNGISCPCMEPYLDQNTTLSHFPNVLSTSCLLIPLLSPSFLPPYFSPPLPSLPPSLPRRPASRSVATRSCLPWPRW